MILTFTDFGASGPYLGQMRLAIQAVAPACPVIDVLSDAPICNPQASAYLLRALAGHMPLGAIVLAVVDPGVGGSRPPVIVRAGGRWFVGPGNGLLDVVARDTDAEVWHIVWRPERLSSTFHGRDLFAPIAARLALGEPVTTFARPESLGRNDWPDDLDQVVYVDHYGNAMTGWRGRQAEPAWQLEIGPHRLPHAQRFDQNAVGQGFWYVNSCGLVEIAVNQGRADRQLRTSIGQSFAWLKT